MPKEIQDVNEFAKLAEGAKSCLVKRDEGVVKLKVKTPKLLYTIKLKPDKADALLKKLKCEVVEL